MTWENRAPGMWVEPIDQDFEDEVMWLAGKRRRGESPLDHLHRISRIRQLLRCEEALERVEALAGRLERGHWRDGDNYAKAIRSALDGAA